MECNNCMAEGSVQNHVFIGENGRTCGHLYCI